MRRRYSSRWEIKCSKPVSAIISLSVYYLYDMNYIGEGGQKTAFLLVIWLLYREVLPF